MMLRGEAVVCLRLWLLWGRSLHLRFPFSRRAAGLPLSETEPLLLLFVASSVASALWPVQPLPAWKRKELELKRLKAESARTGPLTLADLPDFVGFMLGFRPETELYLARMAQLGFAASVLGEALTGEGTLAQLKTDNAVFLALAIAAFHVLASRAAEGEPVPPGPEE